MHFHDNSKKQKSEKRFFIRFSTWYIFHERGINSEAGGGHWYAYPQLGQSPDLSQSFKENELSQSVKKLSPFVKKRALALFHAVFSPPVFFSLVFLQLRCFGLQLIRSRQDSGLQSEQVRAQRPSKNCLLHCFGLQLASLALGLRILVGTGSR